MGRYSPPLWLCSPGVVDPSPCVSKEWLNPFHSGSDSELELEPSWMCFFRLFFWPPPNPGESFLLLPICEVPKEPRNCLPWASRMRSNSSLPCFESLLGMSIVFWESRRWVKVLIEVFFQSCTRLGVSAPLIEILLERAGLLAGTGRGTASLNLQQVEAGWRNLSNFVTVLDNRILQLVLSFDFVSPQFTGYSSTIDFALLCYGSQSQTKKSQAGVRRRDQTTHRHSRSGAITHHKGIGHPQDCTSRAEC